MALLQRNLFEARNSIVDVALSPLRSQREEDRREGRTNGEIDAASELTLTLPLSLLQGEATQLTLANTL